MLKYKCHKVVKATAMNRLAYNNIEDGIYLKTRMAVMMGI